MKIVIKKFVILLPVTLLHWGGFPASLFATDFQQATVTRIVEQVEVISQEGSPQPASLGKVIQGNMAVRTGANSRAQLTFADKTITRLGANTLFSFAGGSRQMDLEKGVLLLQVPKGAGGATIRSAPVIAAITGTTLMMEYSPGSPGIVKVIVLEGSVRVSLTGHLGESVVVNAGEMLTVAADARQLPDPAPVDIARIMKTSRLVNEAELASHGLIVEAINAQAQMLRDGKLLDASAGSPNAANPAMQSGGILNTQGTRRDVILPPQNPAPHVPPPSLPNPPPQIQPDPKPPYTPPPTPPSTPPPQPTPI